MRISLDREMFICGAECRGRYRGRVFARVPQTKNYCGDKCMSCCFHHAQGLISELCGYAPRCTNFKHPFTEVAL